MTTYMIFFVVTAILFLLANFIDRKTEYAHPVWLLYALPLVLMILMYGLREGWMVDFAVYKYEFDHKGSDDVLYEPLFVLTTNIMRGLGFDYHGAMTFWASVPIIGYFTIAKRDRSLTGLIMILFMMVSISYISNTIRWAMAGGVACMSLAMLDQRKYIWAAILAICTPLIHISMAPMVALLWILWWLPFLPKWYYTIPLILLSVFITPGMVAGSFFEFAMNISDSGGIDSDLHAASYITDSEVIDSYFAGERSELGSGMTGLLTIRLLMYFIWFAYEGYQYVKSEPTRLNRMFYITIIGYTIMYIPTFGIELMLRIVFFLGIGIAFMGVRILNWEFKEGRYVPFAIAVMLILINWWQLTTTIGHDYVFRYVSL